MSYLKNAALILSTAVLFLITGCGDEPVGPITGDGTHTGNAITAKLVYPNGDPATNAKVTLRPRIFRDTTGVFAKILVAGDTVTTDSLGVFTLDSLDSGTYVVEAVDNDSQAVRIDSVVVPNDDTIHALSEDTLKPFAAVQGRLYLSEGGDFDKVIVLGLGFNRFWLPGTDGTFRLDSLAKGTYHLKFFSALDNYQNKDTIINIAAGAIFALGPVELAYTGIPTPKNLQISYDTLKQIVTLIWNTPTNGRTVQGYNIYRKNADSTVFVNIRSGLTDTVYRDSTGVQDQTYEYRIAVVDINNTIGVMSTGLPVTVVSAFKFIKNFGTAGTGTGQFSLPADIAVDKNGNYWVADLNRKKVLKFDSSGGFLYEWGDSGVNPGQLIRPFGLDIDSSKNIYVSEWQGSRIQKFDSLGNFIMQIDSSIIIGDVSVDENRNIYATFTQENRVLQFDSSGYFLTSFILNTSGFAILARRGLVYVEGGRDSVGQQDAQVFVEVFNPSGNRIGMVNLRKKGESGTIGIRDLDIDSTGNVYATDAEMGRIRIIDKNLNLLTTFGRKGNGPEDFSYIQGIAISPKGKIAIVDRNIIHLFQAP